MTRFCKEGLYNFIHVAIHLVLFCTCTLRDESLFV
jgi:hypothetical protein